MIDIKKVMLQCVNIFDIRSAGVNTSGSVIKNKIMLNQMSQRQENF